MKDYSHSGFERSTVFCNLKCVSTFSSSHKMDTNLKLILIHSDIYTFYIHKTTTFADFLIFIFLSVEPFQNGGRFELLFKTNLLNFCNPQPTLIHLEEFKRLIRVCINKLKLKPKY